MHHTAIPCSGTNCSLGEHAYGAQRRRVIICALARRSGAISACYHDAGAVRSLVMTKTEYILVGLLFACIAAAFYVVFH